MLDGEINQAGWFEYGEYKGPFNMTTKRYKYWHFKTYFPQHWFDDSIVNNMLAEYEIE